MRRLALVLLIVATACTRGASTREAIIVVSVPVQRAGSLAEQIANGARLAANELNAAGGIKLKDGAARIRIAVRESDYSPTRSVDNVREAIRLGAAAVIDEGTGIDASWRVAAAGTMPIVIVTQGGMGLVDAQARPNVFRIAPTDRGCAFRLAEYLVPKGARLAIVTDDSTYGTNGRAAIEKAFARNASSIAATIGVSAGAPSLSTEILRARHSGATAVLVWARPRLVALAIRAARSTGWEVPFYAATSGSDPLIRQQLADRPEWVDGLTFTISRVQSEKGLSFFETFRTAYEDAYGPLKVGVTSGGRDVVAPPDQAMYPYDAVKVIAAALERAGTASANAALIGALNEVEVQGANGDERSFNLKNHEGVVDDDIFFATMRDMTWMPVKDDPLSATLQQIRQTL